MVGQGFKVSFNIPAQSGQCSQKNIFLYKLTDKMKTVSYNSEKKNPHSYVKCIK